jgi:hypothetical protein
MPETKNETTPTKTQLLRIGEILWANSVEIKSEDFELLKRLRGDLTDRAALWKWRDLQARAIEVYTEHDRQSQRGSLPEPRIVKRREKVAKLWAQFEREGLGPRERCKKIADRLADSDDATYPQIAYDIRILKLRKTK